MSWKFRFGPWWYVLGMELWDHVKDKSGGNVPQQEYVTSIPPHPRERVSPASDYSSGMSPHNAKWLVIVVLSILLPLTGMWFFVSRNARVKQERIVASEILAYEEYMRTNLVEQPMEQNVVTRQTATQTVMMPMPAVEEPYVELPVETIQDYRQCPTNPFVIQKNELKLKIVSSKYGDSFVVSTYKDEKVQSVKFYPMNQYESMFFQWVSEGYTIATDEFSKGITPSKEVIKSRVERNREYREKLAPILLNQYLTDTLPRQQSAVGWNNQMDIQMNPPRPIHFSYGKWGPTPLNMLGGGQRVDDYYRGDGTHVSGYWRDW